MCVLKNIFSSINHNLFYYKITFYIEKIKYQHLRYFNINFIH